MLPDRQPAYVASWIYVFGVTTIAALGVVIVTGLRPGDLRDRTGGTSPRTGLFVNSLHLWSVEVFMFAMVIHLWGKFFMAAWRGRRKATWITGVVSFLVSVGAAFTGYLSQQNFDSQWISTQAKDGINSTGAGAIFNVTNFGQMIMWHIVLLPLAVVALVGLHVLMVRLRGVVTPFAAKNETPGGDVGGHERSGGAGMSADTHKKTKKFVQDRDAVAWHGRYEPYDLAKEFLIALIVVIVLVTGLAVLFGSPDDKPVTVKSWSNADAVGFATTAITELDGTSGTATYGPPYNLNGTTAGKLGPLNPAKWLGVHHPIDTANDYVLGPLSTLPNQPQVPGRGRPVQGGLAGPAGHVERRLREGGRRRQVRQRQAGGARR